jgi:hypothetical protein
MFEIIGTREGEKDRLLGWSTDRAHALYVAWCKLRKDYPEYYLSVKPGNDTTLKRFNAENGVVEN